MAQLFPPWTNTIARVTIAGGVLGIGALGWATYAIAWSPYVTDVGRPREQSVPFSHEHHVAGLGIDCRYCHTSVEKSSFAGVPPTETCMTCHSQVWRDAPVLAPVRESWATGRRLHWTRVNDVPDYVYFNHSIHVKKGVACVSCHGRVDQMPLMWKAQSLYMKWCLECHRAPERHVQPGSEVFVMKELSSDPVGGRELAHASGIPNRRLEDCSICHR